MSLNKRNWLVPMLLLVAGCSGQQQPAATSGRAPAAAAVKAGSVQADDLVAAVTTARSRTPIDVKFRLKSRPQLNAPLEIELALAVTTPGEVTRVLLSLQGLEGFELVSDQRVVFEQFEQSATQTTTLVAMPRRAGIYYITATALVDDSRGGSLSRVYSIPVVVPAASG